MILPQATKVEFWQELEIYEQERKMRYITSVEQIGYDRGVAEEAQRSREQLLEAERSREQLLEAQRSIARLLEVERSREQLLKAQLEAQRSLLVRQLTRKIGPIPTQMIDQVKTLPIAQLESLGEALFDFESIEDLITWLLTFGNLDSINSFPSQD